MQRLCILLLLAGVISAQDSGCGSPRYMTTETGSFASHATFDGETTYDSFSDCHWNIDIPDTNLVVELQFSHMHTEAGANCPFDGLKVYDGVDDTSPILATLCGINAPYPIAATGPSMYCNFYSDFAVQHTGFLANYISRVEPLTCTEPMFLCGNDYNGYCAIQEERCDGKNQCITDEEGCPGNAVNCGEPAIPPDTTWPVANDDVVTIKIVNGTEAVPHSWPWMFSLDSMGIQSCSITLFTPLFE
ncbi:ovochymase-2-like [Saccoglossus kowalevskii]|uniref:CUB and sushi domain-containing protein 1-like n=1 Tax=Saccoglossus kowalevskii TaxID=10224 RepID=A0ABM0MCT3_SACKO|nr:PREDICTED: CUB and sushi domain-containing protein 1-like [Saccoglossus kowalevskii]